MRILHAVAALALAGCTTWAVEARHDEVVRDWNASRIELRDDRLAGSLELVDRAIGFELDRAHACQLVPYGHVSHVTAERKTISNEGIAALGLGAVTAILGLALGVDLKGHSDAQGAAFAVGAAGGVAMFAGIFSLPPARHREYAETRIETESEPIAVPLEHAVERGIACGELDPLATLGELELTTPWGARVTAALDDDGTAIFMIDWAHTGLDPMDPASERKLAGPWQLRAPRASLATVWRMSLADRARAATLVAAATAQRAG